MAIALLALAAVLPCAGANDMVDAPAAPDDEAKESQAAFV